MIYKIISIWVVKLFKSQHVIIMMIFNTLISYSHKKMFEYLQEYFMMKLIAREGIVGL
jgi:hypothetical protein